MLSFSGGLRNPHFFSSQQLVDGGTLAHIGVASEADLDGLRGVAFVTAEKGDELLAGEDVCLCCRFSFRIWSFILNCVFFLFSCVIFLLTFRQTFLVDLSCG